MSSLHGRVNLKNETDTFRYFVDGSPTSLSSCSSFISLDGRFGVLPVIRGGTGEYIPADMRLAVVIEKRMESQGSDVSTPRSR